MKIKILDRVSIRISRVYLYVPFAIKGKTNLSLSSTVTIMSEFPIDLKKFKKYITEPSHHQGL